MKLTSVLQQTNKLTLDFLRKTIAQAVDDAPNYLNGIKEQHKRIVFDKLSKANKWYMKFIGLDEVKLHHGKVIALQEQLYSIQEKRRVIGRQLIDVRDKSDVLLQEIRKTSRLNDSEKFLNLLEQETEVLKMEKSLYQVFQDFDQTERDIFMAFVNAVRESHEKQRAQSEYTKYFGIILSLVGSFLTFVYSSVKKHDLKNFIDKKLDCNQPKEAVERVVYYPYVKSKPQNPYPQGQVVVNEYALSAIACLSGGLIILIMTCCACAR